jgi:nitrogen fixation protein FixH
MYTRNCWPLLIVLLVAGFFALSAWSFHQAASGTSAVTDANYYSHGLRYNQTLLERNAAAALGWDAAVTLTDLQLQIALSDRDRQPVTAALGSLTLHGGSRGKAQHLPLHEDSAGIYLGTLPPGLRGEVTAQVDFEQAGARLSKRLLLSLP